MCVRICVGVTLPITGVTLTIKGLDYGFWEWVGEGRGICDLMQLY
jgi:hypothetical protein